MSTLELLKLNILSPIVLAFVLGVIAKLSKSEFSLPKDLYTSLSIYLLFAIGLKGGVELSESSVSHIAWPAISTIFLGCFIPVFCYVVLRRLGKFSVSDAAGIAAHYGSVSAVTFIAAQQFVHAAGVEIEGYMPTLLTLLESPGINIALAIGVFRRSVKRTPAEKTLMLDISLPLKDGNYEVSDSEKRSTTDVLHEVLTSRTMVLLVGGLLIGSLIGVSGYEPIKPFFESGFKGALTLFLLELGLLAGDRLADLKKVGVFLLGFGIIMPMINGTIAVILGHYAGLSIGGCTVLATMAASASYIAAPPAVRMTLPDANPSYYLTAALGITFPFNLVVGIPLYFRIANFIAQL